MIFRLVAEQLPGEQFRGFGIQKPSTLTVAQLPPGDANLLFATTGLKPGDRVKAVAGVDVNNHWQIEPIIESVFEPNITILAERRESSGQESIVEGRAAYEFYARGKYGRRIGGQSRQYLRYSSSNADSSGIGRAEVA